MQLWYCILYLLRFVCFARKKVAIGAMNVFVAGSFFSYLFGAASVLINFGIWVSNIFSAMYWCSRFNIIYSEKL